MTTFPLRRSKFPRKIADGRFEIRKTLGAGCFGKVYSAIHTETKQEVAVKFEDISQGSAQLQHEAEMLKLLRDSDQPQGFAKHYYFGREGQCQMLVMEFLGHDLEDSLQACHGTFQVKTATLIAEQLLQRLEYLHAKGVVHQDIKPENFVWGVKERQHHLYLIDFGLSKRYYERRHVRMRQHSGLIGTARYASIHAHLGLEQSRRDDLEAAGHMLLYFLRGSLPWSGLVARSMPEKLKRIQRKKESIPVDELCANFPREFGRLLTYSRCLSFKERPDYAMLRQLFRNLRARLGDMAGRPVEDYDFEWNVGKDMSRLALAPLDLTTTYPQPDDGGFSSRTWLGGCFCGAKAAGRPSLPEPGASANFKAETSPPSEEQKLDELNPGAAAKSNKVLPRTSLFVASMGGA